MNNQCPLCKNKDIKVIQNGVRDNKNINVLKCSKCGLEFLDDFYQNSAKYYQSGSMHAKIDTKRWLEKTSIDDNRRFKFLKKYLKGNSLLDFGSGSGNFLKLAFDITTDCAGCELDYSLDDFYKERNLRVEHSLDKFSQTFDRITMFHVLEHLENPKEILEQLKEKLNKNGEIIIEVPNSDDALLTLYKNDAFKNFTYWSCHLFAYNHKNLKILLEQTGFKIKKYKYIQRFPYTNHFGWIKDRKAGGHTRFKTNNLINFIYVNLLKLIKKTDTILVIAKKS